MIDRKDISHLAKFLERIAPFGFSGAALVAQGDEVVLNHGIRNSYQGKEHLQRC